MEKFIACDEYTPITKFRHVAHNSFVALQEVRRMIIQREKLLRKIDTLKKLQTEYNDIKVKNADLRIYEANLELDNIELRIKGLLKEISYMERICEQLEKENGKPFTAEQYQAEEPIYWEKRLASQMMRSIEAMKTGCSEGNCMSLWMAMEKPILPESKNQIDMINYYNINELASKAFAGRPGVGDKLLAPAKPVTTNKTLSDPTPDLPNLFNK